jgi:hypothetical protein
MLAAQPSALLQHPTHGSERGPPGRLSQPVASDSRQKRALSVRHRSTYRSGGYLSGILVEWHIWSRF